MWWSGTSRRPAVLSVGAPADAHELEALTECI